MVAVASASNYLWCAGELVMLIITYITIITGWSRDCCGAQ
jgi:hypothetical protein